MPRKPGPSLDAHDGSLARLMRDYLTHLRVRHFADDTIATTRHALLRFAIYLGERDVRQAEEVTAGMVERYQRHLVRYRKPDGDPLSSVTQIGRLKPVQQFFRWCVKKHHLPADPSSGLDFPRPIKRLPPVLTPDEVERILLQPDLRTLPGVRDRSILETFYSTGMRRTELVRLGVHDVDFTTGVVRIIQGKGRKDRLVPIGGRALAWLKKYLDDVRPRLVVDPAEQALYLTYLGAPFSRDVMTNQVRDYIAMAGVQKPGSCHLFRHSMATALLDAGCDVRFIQEMLGHTNLDTTAQYTHVAVQQMKLAHETYHPARMPADDVDPADLVVDGLAAGERLRRRHRRGSKMR